MKLEIRYAEHPSDVKQYGTKELRNHFLCEKVFFEDEIHRPAIPMSGAWKCTFTLI
ncbi:MAG: hypothetical protein LBP74_05525 [Treponema sp.]|jgi:5-keto 4-deoxyuronate isomerase|nr:hypothetical protein [Treponema sp.]